LSRVDVRRGGQPASDACIRLNDEMKRSTTMIEVCFCGWQGEVADRRYLRLDGDHEGLACPNCGHVDTLDYLPDASRREMFAIARERSAARSYNTMPILRLRTAHPAA
jgi:hypothetical protein